MTELISKYLKEAGYDSFSVSQNGDSFESSLGIDLTTYIEKALVDELRKMRNIRLSETDWWASSDLTMTAEQSAYRKALRDLPSTASPELDSNGDLTGVTWPTKPE